MYVFQYYHNIITHTCSKVTNMSFLTASIKPYKSLNNHVQVTPVYHPTSLLLKTLTTEIKHLSRNFNKIIPI